MKNINDSSREFAIWLWKQLRDRGGLDAEALSLKYKKMRGPGAHPFLRATFYRWAERWKDMEKDAPVVLSGGDVHVENFGTWSTGVPDLAWGINDADEACRLPWVSDMVRLGVSVRFALTENHVGEVSLEAALAKILEGYQQGMAAEPAPGGIRVTPAHGLDGMVKKYVLGEGGVSFWTKEMKKKEAAAGMTAEAEAVLRRAMPAGVTDLAFLQPLPGKLPGTGSLGKRRYYASGLKDGAQVMREVKPAVDSALGWATDGVAVTATGALLASSYRLPDPTQKLDAGWIVRAIAPESGKLQFDDLVAGGTEPQDWWELLRCMGAELSGLHRSGAEESVRKAILAELAARGAGGAWLGIAVAREAAVVEAEKAEFSLAIPPDAPVV